MIEIVEKRSKYLPCYTSLFFKLPAYNKELFDNLVQHQDYIYKDDTFECPINKLATIVRFISKYDLVSFKPFNETSEISNLKYSNKKFKLKPYNYQVEGIKYGLSKNGWLLLDEQGLGKTLQTIYLALLLKENKKIDHCFIICGVNSLKYNWMAEITELTDLSCHVLGQYITRTGRLATASVSDRLKALKGKLDQFFIITNLEMLQNPKFADTFNKSKTNFGMIVFDEAHHAKSPSAKASKTLLKLKADYKVALTGTIITNDPEDAYMPLKWTGNIKCNFSQFKNFYNVYGGFGGVQVIGNKNLELLSDLLSTCSLRRLKSDKLDLPDRTFIKEYVDLSLDQQRLYNEVAEGIAQELDLLKNKKLTIIQEITINMRLRQITAFPGMLSSSCSNSAKLNRLKDLVSQIVSQGDKVVVFNTFKQAAEKEYEMLAEFNPVLCTGNSTDAEIEANKEAFQKGDKNVFIATWQKMGTGHTLNAANYCIFVDTPYTYADFIQAADRIHRIGQNKKVFVITLITKDTYDERVDEIINRKENLSNEILTG